MADYEGREDLTAIALTWDGMTTPKVTAKGDGQLAQQILELAREHNIPIQQEDLHLVMALAQIDVGEDIPQELFLAVAHVIAFAYYVSGRDSVGGSYYA